MHIVGVGERAERQAEHRVEQWAVVFVILLINCFLYLNHVASDYDPTAPADPDSGSAVAQVVWSLVYAGAFVGLIAERRRAGALLLKSWPIALLVVLVALSCFWSSDPSLTQKRAFGLLGTTAISYYIACRFNLWTFVKILAISTTIAAGLSMVAVVAIPSLGVMHGDTYAGSWQGLYPHKNSLGEAMSLGILTLLAVAVRVTGKRRLLVFGAIALCCLLLLGSQSASSLLSTVLCGSVLGLAFLWRSKSHVVLARVATGIVVLAFAAFALDSNALFGGLGRDASLTGRTDLWSLALEAIQSHPLLGYGYGIFWLPDGPYIDFVPAVNRFFWDPDMAGAHNGYLQLALDVGLVGATMFVLTLAYAAWRSMRYVVTGPDDTSIWPLAFIACFAVANMTEVSIASYNNLYWVIFVAAFLYTIREPERRMEGDFASPDPKVVFFSNGPLGSPRGG